MLRYHSIVKWIGVLTLCAVVPAIYAEDWLPITPEELKMTSEPKAPAAPAIFLYRQVDRDDNAPDETIYSRIKILTDEGRKYADVEIPYNKTTESVRGIQARTIRPDGSIVDFSGTIFDKTIVKGRGVKFLAKTFTLPDVQAGSIIEYRYRHNLQYGYVFDSNWILSQELFTKRAKFSLNPNNDFALRYSWPIGLPEGTDPPKKEHRKILLETHDVPAFVTEDYMPPERELKFRVDFIYIADSNFEKDPAAFWKKFGKRRYREIDDFVDKRRVMEQAAAQIVDPSDSAEVKLHKIYARTQQLRNTTFERAKTEQEEKREAQKDAENVADVWKRGYGDGLQITWLFLALVRAAGIEADPVLVSTRDRFFFDARVMNPGQLNSNVVVVKLSGKDLYLDPGTPFTPFGLLPWHETAVEGLRLNKDGGAWITTPLPTASDSHIARKANLRLTTNGSLEGTVTVTYAGLEALWRRLEERNEDDADRKQFLENSIKGDIPTGIDVTLSNKPAWDSSDRTLVAEYDLKAPGWASVIGPRALLAVGIFSGGEKHTFEHAARIHPLYFYFPAESEDEIAIELPTGWQVSSLPQAHNSDLRIVQYGVAETDGKNGTLYLKRDLVVNTLFADRKYYSQLRDFYQTVRTDDEEQMVITSNKTPAHR